MHAALQQFASTPVSFCGVYVLECECAYTEWAVPRSKHASMHACCWHLSLHSSTMALKLAGGIVRDGLLSSQSAGHLCSALAPKLGGYLNLSSSMSLQPVGLTLAFSSVASLLGNAGQVNYAAANAALDAATALNGQRGAAGAVLQWGPWAGGGMATHAVAASLAAKGVGLVQPDAGLELLDRVLAARSPYAGSVSAPINALDWRRILRPAQQQSLFFKEILSTAGSSVVAEPRGDAAHAAVLLPSAVSVEEVQAEVLQLAAGVVGAGMDASAAFMSVGLDSLGTLQTLTVLRCLHSSVLRPLLTVKLEWRRCCGSAKRSLGQILSSAPRDSHL